MKPEAQRIAIAEACGWHNVRRTKIIRSVPGTRGVVMKNEVWGVPPKLSKDEVAPDFCNDLNAMHEAEKVLKPDQIGCYYDTLSDLMDEETSIIFASSAQRAEAFLKTLNLWKEEESAVLA